MSVLHHIDEWQLRPDGQPRIGAGSTVLPVRTSDGTPAVLKVSAADAESEHERLVLRRWPAKPPVRLLRADPPRRALLLERLRPESLQTLSDAEACEIVDALRRLHVPAMPQLRSLTSQVEGGRLATFRTCRAARRSPIA